MSAHQPCRFRAGPPDGLLPGFDGVAAPLVLVRQVDLAGLAGGDDAPGVPGDIEDDDAGAAYACDMRGSFVRGTRRNMR